MTLPGDIITVNMRERVPQSRRRIRSGKAAKSSAPYHHGDLKQALVSAAADLIERDGAEALSLRATARAAGVSQAAPYNHFDGRDDLLATIAAAGFQALEASQQKVVAGAAPTAECFVELGLNYIRYAVEHRQQYRLMFGVGLANWRSNTIIAEAKHASFLPFKSALETYLSDASAETREAVAVAAWGLVHGLSMLRIEGAPVGRTKSQDLARELSALRIFAVGLVALRESSSLSK